MQKAPFFSRGPRHAVVADRVNRVGREEGRAHTFPRAPGGGGGAREGRRRGPDASPPPPRRIAVRCPPGLEQQHHADLCLGCKPGRPQRAEEGSALLRERQHRAPSCTRGAAAASAWAAPSGGCGKQREPGAGGERASVRTGRGRRGRASHGRGQRADPAEPPAAQRRRALPDRRQRGHGQRQGTAGPRGAPSSLPLLGPGPAAAHVAGGRGPCQLLQPPRGPRASAPGSAPVPSPPCADYGRRGGGRVGEDAGHPRFQRYPGYRSQGWHAPRAAVTRGRGPVGEGQRKRMLIVLQVRRGARALSRVLYEPPVHPSSPVLALMRSLSGAARVPRAERAA